MAADLPARLLVGVLPVLSFLGLLIYLDSYKLVRLRAVLLAVLAGGVAAGVGFMISILATQEMGIGRPVMARLVAPLVEELLKGAVLVWLIRSRRVGFLIDASIFGFAVGAGFALVENLYYLDALAEAQPAVWVVRGFGTAIMHGGATAIFAIISKMICERRGTASPVSFVPGYLAAVVVHSCFNHFFLAPMLSAAAVLLLLPPVLYVVYRRSEAALTRWLRVGFDVDAELLRLIHSGRFPASRIGRYLQSLADRFEGEVLADMLCYLRLNVELALKAKGLLLMRDAGFEAPPDPTLPASFDELKYLEKSIGRTGRLAMLPVVHGTDRDRWQLSLLQGP